MSTSLVMSTSLEKTGLLIRPETPADYRAAENLVREAFWNVYRPGCLEHYVLHGLRGCPDFVRELDLVMEKDGRLIGQIVFVRTVLSCDDGGTMPILTMGPISILPEFKRQGYGKILLDYALEKAAALGAGAVCFEGDIGFYGKSGFVVASSKNIHYCDEPRDAAVPFFLLKELTPGYLDGVSATYQPPESYLVDEAAAEEFDALFPPKEKKKLPNQLF